MPDLFEIIESTRAMRRLKPDPVPDDLIAKILRAGSCAPNGGNTQKWRFLVIKDPKIKKAVQAWYKKAFDEVIRPRYLTSEPPPGVTKERYLRQHAAVEYLTDHFHEAPVWIVACLEDGPSPNRAAGSSIYPAVQNMVLAARALGLSIPGELSVIGFDDLDFARVLAPPLTTVAADAEGLGAAAFEALAEDLAGGAPPAEQVLPVRLTVRESTAPPRV